MLGGPGGAEEAEEVEAAHAGEGLGEEDQFDFGFADLVEGLAGGGGEVDGVVGVVRLAVSSLSSEAAWSTTRMWREGSGAWRGSVVEGHFHS